MANSHDADVGVWNVKIFVERGEMKNPRLEEPGAKVGVVIGAYRRGAALGRRQHLDVDAADDVFHHRTIAVHVRGLQVGFERRHVCPLFDDGDDVVPWRGRRDASGDVNRGTVFDAAVLVANDADDAVELGEELLASALGELDRGDDVDHRGLSAIGRRLSARRWPTRDAQGQLLSLSFSG